MNEGLVTPPADGTLHLATLNQTQETEHAPEPAPASGGAKKGGEPPQLKAGKEAHNNEEVRPGEKAEVRTPAGKRMDRYNADKAHIREIKPNNARGRKAGQKQLKGYKKEMDKETGKKHTTELTTYDKSK